MAHYIGTALNTEMLWPDDGVSEPDGSLTEAGYDESDLTGMALSELTEDVEAFLRVAWDILRDVSPDDCGRLLWLTRNDHGTGFWDHDGIAHGSTLTIIARTMGERNLYIGSDGRVHV
jgi:hypothetical protein